MARAHKVKSGETLWAISKLHYGQGHLWPSIYAFNNTPDVARQRGARLVNPHLIHPGEIIFLPPSRPDKIGKALSAPPPITSSPQASTSKPVAPGALPSKSLRPVPPPNPTETILAPDFPFRFIFPEQTLYSVEGPGWRATAKLVGSVFLQRDQKVPLVSYSNKGAEFSAKTQANFALSQLTSEAKISFDRTSGVIKFGNSMTTRASADVPGTKVTFTATPDGRIVGKGSIVMPTLKGRISGFAFVSADLRVDLEITIDDQNRATPQSAFAKQAAPAVAPQPLGAAKAQTGSAAPPPSPPSSGGMLGISTGTWLMVGSVVVVGVMIAQDIVTLGGGISDNAAAIGLAAVMWKAGMTAKTERQRLEPGA